MEPAIAATPLAPAAPPVSIWGLFTQAGLVVKLVMVGLACASVWSWAVIINKFYVFHQTEKHNDVFEQAFWSGQSLDDLYNTIGRGPQDGMAGIFMAAMREWKRSQDSAMRAGFHGLQRRIEKVMDVQIQKEMSRLESQLLFLATTGSAAPFVGLFGTVWGIMTAFMAIASSQNTNLAVVAPGIAEALIATAIGLAAAIPATIFYNKFSADAARIGARLENFADEFGAIISRQLDERV